MCKKLAVACTLIYPYLHARQGLFVFTTCYFLRAFSKFRPLSPHRSPSAYRHIQAVIAIDIGQCDPPGNL